MVSIDGARLSSPAAAERGWFIGRQAELAAVLESARRARGGESWGVLIEGEAGAGKTSFIRRVLAELPDFTVLHAACDTAESGSALGVIGQMLRGRDARSAASVLALGLAEEQAGPRLLAFLTELCASGPIAIVLDDAQWADPPSARALSFVLRRLRGDPVLALATIRPCRYPVSRPGSSAADWRRVLLSREWSRHLYLDGLSVNEVADLADLAWPGGHDGAAAHWLHQYTGGVPALLAALLPGLPADAPSAPVRPLRLPGAVVTAVSGMLVGLPEPSRRLLAAMAVLGSRAPLAVVASVSGEQEAPAAIEPLVEAGLAGWAPGESLAPAGIRYPIYRDAVYQLLPEARRRALHAAAARHVSGITAWWHRAAAAGHPDAGLAAALEEEAERYGLAGEAEPAGMLLLWSSGCTADRASRERRLLLAAERFLDCGKVSLMASLQPHLAACPPSAVRSLALGRLAEHAGRRSQALALFSEARRLAEASDAPYLLRSYADLGLSMIHAERGDARAERQAASRLLAARHVPAPVRQWAQYFLADAAGREAGGPAAALRLLAEITAVPPGAAEPPRDSSVLLWARGMWRALAGQLTAASDDIAMMLRSADEATIRSIGPLAQSYLAFAQFRLGKWRAAAVTAGRAVAAAQAATTAWLRVPAHAIASCVAAVQGEWQQARGHAETAERWQHRAGPDTFAAFPAVAAATIAQARSDYPAMVTALYPLVRRPGPVVHQQAWWRPLHVEALIGAGQLAAARQALAELREFAAASGQLGTAIAWLEAWLTASDGEVAVAAARFEEAACRPAAPDDIPFHRARLAHEHGRFLLSLRQRRSAIRWLREAHRQYALLGARPYLERCEADLSGCGVGMGMGEPSAGSARPAGRAEPAGWQPLAVLSARERRIVYLVASGLTNREVGSELYVSAKTVEYHLGNIFAKLGITSRRQLRSLAQGPGPAGLPDAPGTSGHLARPGRGAGLAVQADCG
ncbi:MAG TPA: AAA family ATPase [Streptosporangiaceae bacterium]|nr:AAA family ATPase [Streptosporangiaceae bacterium]